MRNLLVREFIFSESAPPVPSGHTKTSLVEVSSDRQTMSMSPRWCPDDRVKRRREGVVRFEIVWGFGRSQDFSLVLPPAVCRELGRSPPPVADPDPGPQWKVLVTYCPTKPVIGKNIYLTTEVSKCRCSGSGVYSLILLLNGLHFRPTLSTL